MGAWFKKGHLLYVLINILNSGRNMATIIEISFIDSVKRQRLTSKNRSARGQIWIMSNHLS